jgi:hypothetical protein
MDTSQCSNDLKPLAYAFFWAWLNYHSWLKTYKSEKCIFINCKKSNSPQLLITKVYSIVGDEPTYILKK